MAQFDVFRNPNADTAKRVPYLVDVQHDLVAVFDSRVVVPLVDPAFVRDRLVLRLMPVFTLDDRRLVLMPQSIASLPTRTLGIAALAVAAILTLWSMFVYLSAAWAVLKK